MKRTISLLLSILMVLSLCPVTAFADTGAEEPAEPPTMVETQSEESATEPEADAPTEEEAPAEEAALAEEAAPAE